MSGYILKLMSDRVHVKNKNMILIVVGETGSGKSWAAVHIAEMLDPSFSIDNVIFDVESFIHATQAASKGAAIVFDEAGIGASNRSAMSKVNRAVSALAQSFRHRNTFNILTLPTYTMTDVHLRQLAHFQIETIRVVGDRCLTKFKEIQNNPGSGRVYRKYVKVKDDTVITRLYVNKPSERLIAPYEKKKVEFTTSLYDDLMVKASTKPKEPTVKLTLDDYVAKILEDPKKFIAYHKQTGAPLFSRALIKRHLGVGETYTRDIRQILASEHKYLLDEFEISR